MFLISVASIIYYASTCASTAHASHPPGTTAYGLHSVKLNARPLNLNRKHGN